MKSLSTQVVIIGAGAVGCSIAYSLTKKGVDVTVVEAESIGAGKQARR